MMVLKYRVVAFDTRWWKTPDFMPSIPSVPFLPRACGCYIRGTPQGDPQQLVGRHKDRELFSMHEENHKEKKVKIFAINREGPVIKGWGFDGRYFLTGLAVTVDVSIACSRDVWWEEFSHLKRNLHNRKKYDIADKPKLSRKAWAAGRTVAI
jgi:hypothetical protein